MLLNIIFNQQLVSFTCSLVQYEAHRIVEYNFMITGLFKCENFVPLGSDIIVGLFGPLKEI